MNFCISFAKPYATSSKESWSYMSSNAYLCCLIMSYTFLITDFMCWSWNWFIWSIYWANADGIWNLWTNFVDSINVSVCLSLDSWAAFTVCWPIMINSFW